MKAALLRAFGQPLSLEDVPRPVLADDEVVVRVCACGIDGTDLKLLDGFGYTPDLPFVMGHEPAGVVAEVGAAVTEFRPGERVIPYIFFHCERCRLCLRGREQLCPRMSGVLGVKGHHGGYAQYLKVPARQLVTVPEGLAWTDAAVLCDAGLTAYHAIGRARLGPGETVVVIGVGGVGSFVVQLARQEAARVIAVEQTPAKVEHAQRMGADHVLASGGQDVAAEVRHLTEGWGADCVFDVVGTRATLAAGIDCLASGGRLVVVGYTPEEYPLSGKRVAQGELTIVGTRGGCKHDLRAVAWLAAHGGLHSVVSDVRPFEQVNEALALLRAGRVLGRLVLEMPQA
jgi:propanol-preferring alcohol dehydrogenase